MPKLELSKTIVDAAQLKSEPFVRIPLILISHSSRS
jgi:hypothetical protein